MIRRKLTRAILGATMATTMGLAMSLGVSAPAGAASRYIGSDGAESRCNNSTNLLCLYYSTYSSAYWGTSSDVSNLAGAKFISGTGSGAGQAVKNNAARIHCDYYVSSYCESFYNSNFTGNDDWLAWGQIGVLYYTWNDEASVRIT